ncbi:CBO0543 family protein [Niallia taxi]|uniref:CBO0543 family protein n=1 Tax=Niallia taxi TaxID=2499688 RepID=UPI003D26A1E2
MWWILLDKTKIKKIWLYGALITILIIYLDDIGGVLNLWNYPYQLINIIPRLNPIDISVLPVMHMLIYQYFSKWKNFIIANIIISFCNSYIAEPFFVKIGIYELTNWKYIYSVPIYVMKAILIKFILEKVLQKSEDK